MHPKNFYDGTSLVQRNLAYDQYAEIANQTRVAKLNLAVNTENAALNAQNVQLNQQQLAISQQMSQSLRSIAGIMDDVRKSQKDALAIQQELLMRDQLQSFIEEFIYSTEKLVSECQRPDCDMPISSRYFLLLGVIKTVEQEGLSTPLIRGRDNKSAFERVIASVQSLLDSLASEHEVQEAIAWANDERKRLDEEKKRKQAEKQARQEQQKLERKQKAEKQAAELAELERQLEALGKSRQTVTIQQVAGDTLNLFRKWIPEGWPRKIAIAIAVVLAPFTLMALPVFILSLFMEKSRLEADINKERDAEIVELRNTIQQKAKSMSDL